MNNERFINSMNILGIEAAKAGQSLRKLLINMGEIKKASRKTKRHYDNRFAKRQIHKSKW